MNDDASDRKARARTQFNTVASERVVSLRADRGSSCSSHGMSCRRITMALILSTLPICALSRERETSGHHELADRVCRRGLHAGRSCGSAVAPRPDIVVGHRFRSRCAKCRD